VAAAIAIATSVSTISCREVRSPACSNACMQNVRQAGMKKISKFMDESRLDRIAER